MPSSSIFACTSSNSFKEPGERPNDSYLLTGWFVGVDSCVGETCGKNVARGVATEEEPLLFVVTGVLPGVDEAVVDNVRDIMSSVATQSGTVRVSSS